MTVVTAGQEAEDRVAVASNWKLVWWRFRRHHLAMASAGFLILLYLVVLFPSFFSTQDPERTDARQAFIPVQSIHLFDDGKLSPWVPAIAGKRNPTTLRMEWTTDARKKHWYLNNNPSCRPNPKKPTSRKEYEPGRSRDCTAYSARQWRAEGLYERAAQKGGPEHAAAKRPRD